MSNISTFDLPIDVKIKLRELMQPNCWYVHNKFNYIPATPTITPDTLEFYIKQIRMGNLAYELPYVK